MIRIVLVGCSGKMGKVIANLVNDRNDCTIVAGIDKDTSLVASFPVFSDPFEFSGDADVIVDFSHPSVTGRIIEYALSRKLPVVMATTGLSAAQQQQIADAAKDIPVFFSANMSLGVNLITNLAKKAAALLDGSFDIEIVEKHHNQKIDAPSGTALMIANAISDSLNEKPNFVYDRHSVRKKRDKNEIGIHSVRGGTIVGEHEVIFAGRDEIVSISHIAMSKEIFAVGAVNAANFIVGKKPGLYDMGSMLSEV